MYRTVSPNETEQRKQNEVLRLVMDGKTNNTGTFTLTASATSTTITDLRTGADSVILYSPSTANAASEWAGGSMYISAVGKQSFTVTHANAATTDRTFYYAVIG